jgi:hypothetical protein
MEKSIEVESNKKKFQEELIEMGIPWTGLVVVYNEENGYHIFFKEWLASYIGSIVHQYLEKNNIHYSFN